MPACSNKRWGGQRHRIRHLDFGGGSGLLSQTLSGLGWNSQTYDPVVEPEKDIAELGDFDLVTAYEVCEHVPDTQLLATRLASLCRHDGMILFSTFCSDGFVARGCPLEWRYASPNGHISPFSRESLKRLFRPHGLIAHSFSPQVHIAYRRVPDWFHIPIG